MSGARVEPHQQFGTPPDPGQCALEHLGRVGVPPVGGDDHQGTSERAAVRCGQQPGNAAAQMRAAVTVGHLGVGPGQRHLR